MRTTGCILDLFRQQGGASPGLVTSYDHSRWHHDVTLHNVTWTQGHTGVWIPLFNGTSAYMDATHASTEAMGITGGLLEGYTIMGWCQWIDTSQSEIIIARYELDVGGWELYLTENAGVYYLTQRHHHAGTIVDTHPRSATNSVGWIPETSYFFTVVFQGNGMECLHYRNGVVLATTSSTGNVRDFESTTQDLVIGTRFTTDANWYESEMGGLRMFNYIMSPAQIRARYHAEKYLVGVAS